jgi:hypothetical protein
MTASGLPFQLKFSMGRMCAGNGRAYCFSNARVDDSLSSHRCRERVQIWQSAQ